MNLHGWAAVGWKEASGTAPVGLTQINMGTVFLLDSCWRSRFYS